MFSRCRKTIALLSVMVLATVGCGVVPVTVHHEEPDTFVDYSTLKSWLGSTEAQVEERLGAPDWGLQDGEIRHYLYRGYGRSTDIDVHIIIFMPIPLPQYPGDETGKSELWCLKLTFSPTLSSYEKLLKPESAEDCRTAFWWPRSVDSMEAVWKENRAAKLRESAEAGDRAASLALASEFDDSSYLEVLASDGDKKAALVLAKDFDEPAYLRALAETGDDWAEFELAKLGGHQTTVETLANKGNLVAAFVLYNQLSLERQTTPDAWKWLCVAANNGSGEAQAEVGYWHRTVVWRGLSSKHERELQVAGVDANDRIAYMWYTLAVKSGDEYAAQTRTYVVKNMTPEEIAQAEQMARDWKPGDCPSAEHRLGLPR